MDVIRALTFISNSLPCVRVTYDDDDYDDYEREFKPQLNGMLPELHALIFLDGPTPASFTFIFGLFKQTIQFLQQINVKKCQLHPVYGTRIQTHDFRNMNLLP